MRNRKSTPTEPVKRQNWPQNFKWDKPKGVTTDDLAEGEDFDPSRESGPSARKR
jgi:hypothetical protein